MVRIVSATTGKTLGYTDNPHFIRKHENGCNVEASADTATGVALRGVAYNLLDKGEVADAVDTVIILEHDVGDSVEQNQSHVSEVYARLDYLSMMSGIEFPEAEPETTPEGETTPKEETTNA